MSNPLGDLTARQSSPLLPTTEGVSRPTALTRWSVERLFGLYSYSFEEPTPDLARLMILYGDNGCGKTTILRLIFHLLSKEDDRGHRSYLGGVPFRRFSVTLGDTTEVVAERSGEELIGTHRLTIRK